MSMLPGAWDHHFAGYSLIQKCILSRIVFSLWILVICTHIWHWLEANMKILLCTFGIACRIDLGFCHNCPQPEHLHARLGRSSQEQSFHQRLLHHENATCTCCFIWLTPNSCIGCDILIHIRYGLGLLAFAFLPLDCIYMSFHTFLGRVGRGKIAWPYNIPRWPVFLYDYMSFRTPRAGLVGGWLHGPISKLFSAWTHNLLSIK